MTDNMLKLVHEVESKAVLKYNKHYIGLAIDGSASNFVAFIPRKAHMIMSFKLPKSGERDESLEAAGLATLAYDVQYGEYRLRIDSTLNDSQRGVVLVLIRQARENYRR
jgi:hypothetical protein